MNDSARVRDAAQLVMDGTVNESPEATKSSPVSVAEASRKHRIVIAATFTADLLKEPIEFWMRRAGLDAEISLSPYAQVMQELLNPASAINRNRSGFNVVLIRMQDWIRDRNPSQIEENISHVERLGESLATAVSVSRDLTQGPLLLILCPASRTQEEAYAHAFQAVERRLIDLLKDVPGVQCVSHREVEEIYPVAVVDDPVADRLGHIPYTPEYYVAIATFLARRVCALVKPACKVIAVDCDHTLWRGICGEDGARGVELTPAHLQLQRALLRQHDAGVLLCLCSKNNTQDVWAVFEAHPSMPLRPDHFISNRINWEPKSNNLRSLAQELELGLDSFVLFDDSTMECAEVASGCPSVLTVNVPKEQEEILALLDHCWILDRLGVTEDAAQRVQQYKKNRERKQALASASSIEAFMASLDLEVAVTPMTPDQLGRVAELIQRTNQFNLSGRRRSAGELGTLIATSAMRCLVVKVRDRFGDYGLVGAVLAKAVDDRLEVDTFVLSCRVLGRGVEHKIVNELGRVGRKEGLAGVVLTYRKTDRNEPARAFLDAAFPTEFQTGMSVTATCETMRIDVAAEHAEHLTMRLEAARLKGAQREESRSTATDQRRSEWKELLDFAVSVRSVSDIARAIRGMVANYNKSTAELVAPRNDVEQVVARIWGEVLRRESISVAADFIELGGDSVLAVQVIARLAAELDAELSVFDFFEEPTVEGIAKRLGTSAQLDTSIPTADRTRPLPLAWAQQRLWFIDRLEGASAAYHVPLGLRLRGELLPQTLQSALDWLVARHESLRSVFVMEGGNPVQKILSDLRCPLVAVDLEHLSEEDQAVAVREHLRLGLDAPFNLNTGPLIRGRLLRCNAREHVLLITIHHIISDGWSRAVLLRELGEAYQALAAGHEPELPQLPVQYVDYVRWQSDWLAQHALEGQVDFWRQQLEGAPALLELPYDAPRPPRLSYRGGAVKVAIDAGTARELKQLCREHNVTLAMALYCGWNVLLARLTGADDIVVGVPVANRRRSEFEGLIGLFVNTLAVRTRVDVEHSVEALLQQVKATMLRAYEHQDAPFEKVVEALNPIRSLSFSPVFQVAFTFHNTPKVTLQMPDLKWLDQEVEVTTAQFDLSLSLQEAEEGIVGELSYASDLFSATTIESWAAALIAVLRHMAQSPTVAAGHLRLTQGEPWQAMRQFAHAALTDVPEGSLHELFEQQVRRTPEATAVVFNGRVISFGALDEEASRLADLLRRKGVSHGHLVALCVDRGLGMFVGLLAIWKAGGAYLPLDPTYPAERLSYMIADAAPTVLLTDNATRERVPETSAEVIALDGDWPKGLDSAPTSASARAGASHLAYVIYTSGSTGAPKGVMVEHRHVTTLWRGLEGYYSGAQITRVALNASLNFDASVQQVVQLLSGRAVFVVPQQVRRDVPKLLQFLDEHGIEAIDCTPSQLKAWLAGGLLKRFGSALRLVLVGGEPIDPELWAQISACSSPMFVNVYGPTECTVDATAAVINHDGSLPHIGRPMPNRRIYVLDRAGRPVPPRVPGEIFIAGAAVARGYMNRPELTAERFMPDPLDAANQGRMYKTGDLARWRGEGVIEYLGRNDAQVKIRGFRIEPAEIEAALVRHEDIAEAAVIAREDVPGDKRLVAYFRPKRTQVPSIEQLRLHLRASLPEHMVPAAFVMLDHMPMTASGKLDARALPPPPLEAYARSDYEAPKGEVETVLAAIWQDLLKVEQIGRADNFFALGGHSLMVVQLLERLGELGWSAEVSSVFERPALADLACALVPAAAEFTVPPNLIPEGCDSIQPDMLPLLSLNADEIESIVRATPGGASNIKDIYPLAPLQEGILFHHLLNTNDEDVYVVSTLLSVRSRQRLDDFIDAMQSVVDRHDALRTSVLWESLAQPVQVVARHAEVHVQMLEGGQSEVRQDAHAWMRAQSRRIDLRQAPPLRITAAPAGNGQWWALLQLHHIVGDHTSHGILISEVAARVAGNVPQLPPAISYRNHVAHSLSLAARTDAEAFFRAKLGDVDEPTAPYGLLDVHGASRVIVSHEETLSPHLSVRIRAQAREQGISVATLLHAAWALVVARTSGRDDVVFGSVLLGRLQAAAGVRNIIGMFINTLPLRLRLREATALTLVKQAQEELIGLLSHEQASLSLAQRCSSVGGNAPLFTTLFNYRHAMDGTPPTWEQVDGVHLLESRAQTNYPITISVDDLGGNFRAEAQTDHRIDPASVIGCLVTATDALLSALEQSSATPALQLRVLPAEMERAILQSFNATAVEYEPRLVHEIFEEQARTSPASIALVHGEESMTYGALNHKANELAALLRRTGVGPDHVVAVCVERSIEMVAGLLGILKAGAGYLPLDPTYPSERLAYMLEDAAPRALLTHKKLAGLIPSTDVPSIYLDELEVGMTEGILGTDSQHVSQQDPASLLYLIYTSGSTGRPKGTAMPHGAMTNLIQWHRSTSALGTDERVLQFAALSFDVAFQEIFTTLCTGASLVLLDEWVRRDAAALMRLLKRQRISRLFIPPMMLQSLADEVAQGEVSGLALRDVITAGEQLRVSPEIVQLFRSLPQARLHNHYGPTETHVITALTLEGDPGLWPALPSIGRPIANTQIYLLSPQEQPVPVGATGELYIGGASVARGYLGKAALTASRFIASSYGDKARAIMYRTGDLGRWHRDGTIEYLGRNDDQAKLRGYRIELGEIEAELVRCSQVREAAVVVREDTPGQKRLVAYITLREDASIQWSELRDHLKRVLPEHMVPSALVVMDALPMTPSGKLNRRALPVPAELSTSNDLEPPQGELEQRLLRIWSELLKLERIGRRDNFFDLGGHSLLVLKAISRINAAVGASLNVSDFYKHPTLAELAQRISDGLRADEFVTLAREATLACDIVGCGQPAAVASMPVLLTGATGFVGRFLLAELLASSDSSIYCLVRARSRSEAGARLKETLQRWDLWRDEHENRIIAVPGDLKLQRLGVDSHTWRVLCTEVGSIYHNGTSMNHLETYTAAKRANVESASELLRLASTSAPKVVNFISTLGVFSDRTESAGRVVNEASPIDHEKHPASSGYGASKWVGEKIFMIARDRGIPCNIFRLGLIWADAQRGRYDELQRGYRLIKSCLLSGVGLQSFHHNTPATPVDYAVKAVVHLANHCSEDMSVFHISNPREAVEGLFEACNDALGTALRLLPYYEWLREMKQLHDRGMQLPIIPLVEQSFGLSKSALLEEERRLRASAVRFDCAHTRELLERGGIEAPLLDARLVRRCLESMFDRDSELARGMIDGRVAFGHEAGSNYEYR